jgi:hypothetical protein
MKTPIIEGISQTGLTSYLAARQYEALYWPTFFPLKNVNSLDAKTLIGAQGSRVAGAVISYDSKAPEASRKSVSTKYFDIPKIAIKRVKSEKEILEHQITKSLRGQDAVIEDYFADADFVFDSVQARMEWYALQAISLGQIQLSTTNNPLGIVNETAVTFGVPDANKKCATAVYATTAATFIADSKVVTKAARALGISLKFALMNPDVFDLITASTEMQNACKSRLVGESTMLGDLTLDVINKVMVGLRLPTIVIVETSVGIEAKSGVITQSNPFDVGHITYIPDVKLGEMYNGPIAEEIEKPLDVIQTKKANVLISMKKGFDPVNVTTKGEANAFPSWPTVDQCFNLYVENTSTWAV